MNSLKGQCNGDMLYRRCSHTSSRYRIDSLPIRPGFAKLVTVLIFHHVRNCSNLDDVHGGDEAQSNR